MSPKPRFIPVVLLTVLVYAGLWWGLAHPELFSGRVARELLMWTMVASLLALYWLGYKALQNESQSGLTGWLIGGALVATGLAMATAPFHSTDLFGYINRGWQQVAYGVNPYVHPVDDIPRWEYDRMFTDHWIDNPSPYGFLYLQLARLLTWLGGGSPSQTVWMFKGFNLLLHAGIATLIWDAARRMGSTEAARRSLYLYAWNPLIILHALANGHNDIVMGFFLALAAWFALVGMLWAIIPALVAATLIKYAPVVLLPFALWLLIRQKAYPALWVGVLVGLVVFAAAGSSYLPDWQHFAFERISRNAFVSHSSIHSVLFNAFQEVRNVFPILRDYEPAVRSGLKNLLLAAYAIFYALLIRRAYKTPDYAARPFTGDALLAIAVLICLVSLKFYPWYAVIFLPLAFFLPEGDVLRRLVILLSGFQMLAFTLIGQAHFLNFFLMTCGPLAWLEWERRQKKRQATGLEASADCSTASGGEG